MTLMIDRELFLMTFAADGDYHTNLEGQQTYLDRSSGLLLYTVTNAWRVAIEMGEEVVEDYLESTSLVRADPDRYLLVPSMSHAEHHSVMREFLASEWCPDSGRRSHASESYYSPAVVLDKDELETGDVLFQYLETRSETGFAVTPIGVRLADDPAAAGHFNSLDVVVRFDQDDLRMEVRIIGIALAEVVEALREQFPNRCVLDVRHVGRIT